MSRAYRVFLEPPSSGTDSYVQVNDTDDWLELTVADCGNRVVLSFGLDSWRKTRAQFEARRRRKLAKLEKMEKALALIREALESAEYKEGDEV